MYYRQEGNIVRNPVHKQHNLENDTKEDFEKDSNQLPVQNADNNSSSNCGNFPLWALILVILALLILGICLIIWVWKK